MDIHDGKVAVITGGSSGMGLATARLLLAEGARVVIAARGKDALDVATRDLDGGDHLLAVECDLADIRTIRALIDKVATTFGKIDILFANAGIGIFTPVEEVSEEEFDTLTTVNFKGTFFAVQLALPALNDGASIVINASWTLHRALPDSSVYSATKAAVHNLARSFSIAFADRRIRVNSISPGFINTGQFNEKKQGRQAARKRKAHIPFGEFGTVDDIANAVSFLCSERAKYVNGQDLLVDSGMVTAFLP